MTDEPFDLYGVEDDGGIWPPIDHRGDMIDGFSNCYAVKVREMFFPEIDELEREMAIDTMPEE